MQNNAGKMIIKRTILFFKPLMVRTKVRGKLK